MFSLDVSNFAGGVHGHQAIVSFLPLVTTVDHGARHRTTAYVSRARANARRVDRPAEELSASSAFCK